MTFKVFTSAKIRITLHPGAIPREREREQRPVWSNPNASAGDQHVACIRRAISLISCEKVFHTSAPHSFCQPPASRTFRLLSPSHAVCFTSPSFPFSTSTATLTSPLCFPRPSSPQASFPSLTKPGSTSSQRFALSSGLFPNPRLPLSWGSDWPVDR